MVPPEYLLVPAIGVLLTSSVHAFGGAPPGAGTAPCLAISIDTADCIVLDNSSAPGSIMDPGCANFTGSDLWFAMPVPLSGNVIASTADAGGMVDSGVALWTGPDCGALTLRACDDDGGPNYFSRAIAFELPPGEILFIQVFGYGGETGSFQLCIADPGQVELDSTELPIVVINTLGNTIPDDGKVAAWMEMKYNGPGTITYLTSPSNEYEGHIGIGLRGATSAGYPQRPFAIETRDSTGANNNVSLLGMPAENDWVLLSNYNDRSLVRNELAYHLARAMGQYAPRTHLCEVLIDSAYQGIYVFGEKIKRDDGRVDIARLYGFENSGDDLTGGYILQHNYPDPSASFTSNFSPIDHPEHTITFNHEYPEPDSISQTQRMYIAQFVDTLETTLYSTAFADPITGYRKYVDVPSFINYFLVNEVARNNDGFKKSVFLHKDKDSNGGRLKAGPVWDFDWAWKNMWGCDIFGQLDGSGWAHRVNDCPIDNPSSGWYVRLLQDSTFSNELRCVYSEQRVGALSNAAIFAFIDSVGAVVQNAQARHFQQWPILGQSGPAPEVLACATTYNAELDTLKAWIAQRLEWLDGNIPGLCASQGVQVGAQGQGFRVFPNPGTGQFRFEGTLTTQGPHELLIRDAVGRVVERSSIVGTRLDAIRTIPTPGAYSWSILSVGKNLWTGKLIVH